MSKGRKAKCQVTGQEMYIVDMFKLETLKGNKYYVDEKTFEKHETWKTYRQKTLGLFAENIMGFGSNSYLDTYTLKRFKELNQGQDDLIESRFPFEVIYALLQRDSRYIKSAVDRITFQSAKQKSAYAIAILENRLPLFYEDWKIKERMKEQKKADILASAKEKREMQKVEHKNRNDISDLLEEFDI